MGSHSQPALRHGQLYKQVRFLSTDLGAQLQPLGRRLPKCKVREMTNFWKIRDIHVMLQRQLAEQ
jgi:primosomal protein N''